MVYQMHIRNPKSVFIIKELLQIDPETLGHCNIPKLTRIIVVKRMVNNVLITIVF